MPSACAQRGRPSEALGRTVSQSAGWEAYVANCSITPSSSTSVTFADCWESTLPTTIRTARTTRLKRRLPAVAGSRRCYRGSQAAGRSASPVPLGCVEEWADGFWRATGRITPPPWISFTAAEWISFRAAEADPACLICPFRLTRTGVPQQPRDPAHLAHQASLRGGFH